MMSKKFLDSSLFKDKAAFERLKCPYCKQLLHSPVQPSCGHRLCQLCADDILNNASRDPPTCPLIDCKEEFVVEDGEPVRLRKIIWEMELVQLLVNVCGGVG